MGMTIGDFSKASQKSEVKSPQFAGHFDKMAEGTQSGGNPMPLRDHFRPPLANARSWDEVHGQWPAMMVLALNRKLPGRYIAAPQVHLGSVAEIDVSAYDTNPDGDDLMLSDGDNGRVATAVWAPAKPSLVLATDLAAIDEYEVRVYDEKHHRRLVAAIEIVSPANKDRTEHRRAFAARCAGMLQKQVSVTIVDPVTNRADNLYRELLDLIGERDPALGNNPPATYAVACRTTKPDPKPGTNWQLEAWLHPLVVGQPLPTLPLWLADNLAIPLELEASYEETCRALRIG
jgi:hypothetical protein